MTQSGSKPTAGDERLSLAWRDASRDEPGPALDDAIRGAARKAVGSGPRPTRSSPFAARWGIPMSVAAILVVSATITLLVAEHDRRGTGVLKDAAPPRPSTLTPSPAASEPQPLPQPAPADAMPAERASRESNEARPGSPAEKVPAAAGVAASSETAPAAPPAAPIVQRSDTGPVATPPVGGPGLTVQPEAAGRLGERDEQEAKQSLAKRRSNTPQPQGMAPQAQGRAPQAQDQAPQTQERAPQAKSEAPISANLPGAQSPQPAAEPAARAQAQNSSAQAAPAQEEDRAVPPKEWLDRILALRREGKFADAARSLKAFRERYPDYPLPEELRTLQ